jgi:hypothetical protein
MAKTLKQIFTKEEKIPPTNDETNEKVKSKHPVKKTKDANGNDDKLFKSSNVKQSKTKANAGAVSEGVRDDNQRFNKAGENRNVVRSGYAVKQKSKVKSLKKEEVEIDEAVGASMADRETALYRAKKDKEKGRLHDRPSGGTYTNAKDMTRHGALSNRSNKKTGIHTDLESKKIWRNLNKLDDSDLSQKTRNRTNLTNLAKKIVNKEEFELDESRYISGRTPAKGEKYKITKNDHPEYNKVFSYHGPSDRGDDFHRFKDASGKLRTLNAKHLKHINAVNESVEPLDEGYFEQHAQYMSVAGKHCDKLCKLISKLSSLKNEYGGPYYYDAKYLSRQIQDICDNLENQIDSYNKSKNKKVY